MRKVVIAVLAAATALTGAMSAGLASAQPYDHQDRDHYDRDHQDRDHYDRDHRDWNRGPGPGPERGPGGDHWRYYGHRYGYAGYRGPWREGQRYPHWRDHRYVVDDWRAYHLPPPQPGYRYYRDDNGDVVMAAVASGMIGLILGGALSH